jgi:hypothetical protein
MASELIIGSFNSVEGKQVELPSHQTIVDTIIDEKKPAAVAESAVGGNIALDLNKEIGVVAASEDGENEKSDADSDNVIIITGEDASKHLLSLRDDKQPALTFRSIVLATILSGFQACMYQIYNVS